MGMDDQVAAKEALALAYKAHHRCSGTPDWAFKDIAPAIPHVGTEYFNAPRKILIYASTENLAWTDQQEMLRAKGLDDQLHRAYGAAQRADEEQNVMIEPINNGSLLMAARHALHAFDPELAFTKTGSSDFLQQVVVANASKFSIASRTNIDPASRVKYWPASKPYLETDLAVLQPHIVIIPRTILFRLRSRKISLDLQDVQTLLPNYQITSRTLANIKKLGLTEATRGPSLNWKLTLGAERWGMKFYLKWLEEVAVNWIERRKE